jgi:plasmid stabilization system protein ParE
MEFDVIFSDDAEDTFHSIGQQLAERFGEREENEFRHRVYQVVQKISKFPYMFKAVGNDENLRKAFIHLYTEIARCFMMLAKHPLRYFSFGITDKTLFYSKAILAKEWLFAFGTYYSSWNPIFEDK